MKRFIIKKDDLTLNEEQHLIGNCMSNKYRDIFKEIYGAEFFFEKEEKIKYISKQEYVTDISDNIVVYSNDDISLWLRIEDDIFIRKIIDEYKDSDIKIKIGYILGHSSPIDWHGMNGKYSSTVHQNIYYNIWAKLAVKKFKTTLHITNNNEDMELLLKTLNEDPNYHLEVKLGTHCPKFLENKKQLSSAPFQGYKVTIYKYV